MSVSVRLPRELRQVYSLPMPVEVEGGTVGEVITALDGMAPGVGHRLVDAGRLRRHIIVFVGTGQGDLDTPVPADGDVTVVTAVAGGELATKVTAGGELATNVTAGGTHSRSATDFISMNRRR